MGARRRRRRRVRFFFCARVSRSQRKKEDRARRDTERESFLSTPEKHRQTSDPKGAFSVFTEIYRLFSHGATFCCFFLTLPWRAFLFDRSDADDRGAASEASATLGDRGVRPASRGGCGRGAERVRPRPGLRPVWSAFGGARGATRRSSRTDSARSISGRSSDRGARRGEARTRSAMCVTMAQESVSSASMPGAAYGDDVARDIPEKELSPAESAFAGPARVADQCDPAETVILHAPVDAVMTYTWDARRGRNLHVAWPANIPELARHEPPRTDSARGGGITPFDRTRTPGDSILVVKRGAERAAYPKAANAALADTKEIEKIEKIEKTFTPALRSLRAPRFPTAQAREASARWPQLLLRGQTHRRLNAFGPGVAPPGARLTGAPDWALEDDEDEDDTATVSADAPPRASVRVTHVARRDGEVVARQRRVREDALSVARSASRAGTKPSRARCAPARRAARRTGAFPAWSGAPRTATRLSPPGRARAKWHPPRRNRRRYPSASTRTMPTWRRPSATVSRRTSRSGTGRRRSRFRGRKRTCRGTPRGARRRARSGMSRRWRVPWRVARARGLESRRAATLAAFKGDSREVHRGVGVGGVGGVGGGRRRSPDASPGARAASRGRRLAARGGLGGGNLPFEPSDLSVLQSSRRADDTRETRRSVGERSVAPTRLGDAGDPTSPASHIARLGALSASFSDRQRAMVGRGVQEARTRIRDERSWGK